MRLLDKQNELTISDIEMLCMLVEKYKLASLEFKSLKIQSTSLTHVNVTMPATNQSKQIETEDDLLFHSSG